MTHPHDPNQKPPSGPFPPGPNGPVGPNASPQGGPQPQAPFTAPNNPPNWPPQGPSQQGQQPPGWPPQGQQPPGLPPQGPPPPGWPPQGFPGVPGGHPYPGHHPNKKKSKLPILLVVTIVLIAAAGGGAWYFLAGRKSNQNTATASTSTSPTSAAPSSTEDTTSTESSTTESSTSESPEEDSPSNVFLYCDISPEKFRAAGMPYMTKDKNPSDNDVKMPENCIYSTHSSETDDGDYSYSSLGALARLIPNGGGDKLGVKDIFKDKTPQQTTINNKTVYYLSGFKPTAGSPAAECRVITETAYLLYFPDDSTCSTSRRLVKVMGGQ